MYNRWLIHVDVWQKPTQHCKAIILQLRMNKFFKLKKKIKTGDPYTWERTELEFAPGLSTPQIPHSSCVPFHPEGAQQLGWSTEGTALKSPRHQALVWHSRPLLLTLPAQLTVTPPT